MKTIVIKIGSSLLANEENLTLRYAFMHGLMEDIQKLKKSGYQVIITSSGSVALGLSAIGETPASANVCDRHAAAAFGQPLLMNAYRNIANEHNLSVAQILVTLDDMQGRRRFLSIQDTLYRLMRSDIVPVVNENDTVAVHEAMVGDNDRLAAQVAQMVNADYLVILTSIDGLYDRNPEDPDAQFIAEVDDVSPYIDGTQETNGLGSGGMYTKLQAANFAQKSGCHTLIAKGVIESPITSLFDKSRRYTICKADEISASPKDLWLTNRLSFNGALTISGATEQTVREQLSDIMVQDILKITGSFGRGEVALSSDEIEMLARAGEENFESLMEDQQAALIISADNLIMLNAGDLQVTSDLGEEKIISFTS